MRFPRETRAAIHEAAPHPVTIPWPAGAGEPQVGRTYWLQSLEDAEASKKRREESPDTCAEVMAAMNRRAGKEPAGKRKGRHRASTRPHAGEPRIFVIDSEILDDGWEAKVAIFDDPDPVEHLGVRTKVPAGLDPIDGFQVATETEPEQMKELPTLERRRQEEDALRIEHKASVDRASVMKAEQHLNTQRRKGKRSKLAEEAVERAKKREAVIEVG